MKRWSILYFLKFILAFCSIVYELLLAQSLSAFMEDTVLRYCVTIGLYMFSLGVGAWLVEGRVRANAVLALAGVEIALTVIGGFSVAALYALDIVRVSRLLFAAGAHAFIIIIGVLTGMEIPLVALMRGRERADDENRVLASDYAGAFAGTLLFAFVFYARLGLVASAFWMGLLNATAGILLFTQADKVPVHGRRYLNAAVAAQAALAGILIVCLFNAGRINEFFILRYMR